MELNLWEYFAELQSHFLRLERVVSELREEVARLKKTVTGQQVTFERLHDCMELDDDASESAENSIH